VLPEFQQLPEMGDPQKWLLYFMENPIKMDDLGVL
jgi:hypothetical protein